MKKIYVPFLGAIFSFCVPASAQFSDQGKAGWHAGWLSVAHAKNFDRQMVSALNGDTNVVFTQELASYQRMQGLHLEFQYEKGPLFLALGFSRANVFLSAQVAESGSAQNRSYLISRTSFGPQIGYSFEGKRWKLRPGIMYEVFGDLYVKRKAGSKAHPEEYGDPIGGTPLRSMGVFCHASFRPFAKASWLKIEAKPFVLQSFGERNFALEKTPGGLSDSFSALRAKPLLYGLSLGLGLGGK